MDLLLNCEESFKIQFPGVRGPCNVKNKCGTFVKGLTM